MVSKHSGHSNLQTQIEEMEKKIQLSDGDKRAFLKKSEIQIKENRELILKLREELKQRRKEIANEKIACDLLMSKELKKLPEEKKFLVNKSPDAVVETMDEKTIDLTNALNMARFETKKKQNELESIKIQIKNCGQHAVVLDNDSKLRELENSVDKTNMKCKEAEHIQRTYHQIRSKLEDEQTAYGTVLDEAETEIKRLRMQLKELKAMYTDVCEGRNAARAELERKEREYHLRKRNRELDVERYRKEAEELRHKVADVRNGEQKDQQSTTDNSDFNPLGESTGDSDKLREFEECFGIIKAAVGVSDTKEVVKRFESQKERQIQLSEMKEQNETKIRELMEDKNNKILEYQHLQFSIDDDEPAANEKLEEDLNFQLQESEKKMEIAKSKLENYSKLLTSIKTGVEHLMEKLKNINIPPNSFEARSDMGNEELILAQLDFCEEKLAVLHSEEKLLDSVMNDGKRFLLKGHEEMSRRRDIPAPSTSETKFGDDSSDENEETASRNLLKKQSQDIIENKTRKRHTIKRKKRLN